MPSRRPLQPAKSLVVLWDPCGVIGMPEVMNAVAKPLHRGSGGAAFINDIAAKRQDDSNKHQECKAHEPSNQRSAITAMEVWTMISIRDCGSSVQPRVYLAATCQPIYIADTSYRAPYHNCASASMGPCAAHLQSVRRRRRISVREVSAAQGAGR